MGLVDQSGCSGNAGSLTLSPLGHGLSLLRSCLGAKILSLQPLLYNVSLEMVTAVKWHLKSLTLAGNSILILRTSMESVRILLKYLSEYPKK